MKFFIGADAFRLEVEDTPGNPKFLGAGITTSGALELTFSFPDTTPANSVFDFIEKLKNTIASYPEVYGVVETIRVLAEIHIIAHIASSP